MTFDHYLLRPIHTGDIAACFQLIDNNRQRLEDSFPNTVAKNKTPEDTILYVKEVQEKAEARTYFAFLLVDTLTQELVGFFDLKNIHWNIPKGELGYFMDAKYAGKGLATQALAKMVAHCFETLHFNKLLIRTHPDNGPSRKIAEKNGFVIEGLLRNDHRTTKGELVDLVYYGRVRMERR